MKANGRGEEYLVASSKLATVALISQTISLVEINARVGSNFDPFSRRKRSV